MDHVVNAADITDHGDEFVATEADGHIGWAEARGEPLSDRLQDLVTHHVSHRVVDLFEAVDIDKQDGEPVVGFARLAGL
jgi:hypothetical protein